MHTSKTTPSHLLLAYLVFLFYGSFQAAAMPAPKDCLTDCIASTRLLTKTASSTNSATKHLGEVLCTRATVTVVSTEISVSTKTHTVTERVVGPTRLGPRACIDCTPSIKSHSTSKTSTTTHKKTTAPALAITRRVDERGECKECLTAGILPELVNVKTMSTTTSKAKTKSSKTKSHTIPTTTSWAIIHSIHFGERMTTALPGHAILEDAPKHGEKRNKCEEYIGAGGHVLKGC